MFFMEVVVSGLLAGVMYSLVALGFVLIFKASGVFNFAQGSMVLFAALNFVGLQELGVPLWLATILTIVIMIGLAWVIEKLVLRPLVNQEPISLFMATIGLTFFLDGFGQQIWGSDVKKVDIGVSSQPIILFDGMMYLNPIDLVAGVVGGVMVFGLAVFFSKTRTGRALRAVADDHQASLSVGIPLQHIWVIVWSVAGIVALIAGIMWGSKTGVQFSLSLVALKALPVLILGGFTSVPGAIVGGLIIGTGEKLAEVYLPGVIESVIGVNAGGIEGWFAFMLAMAFLMFRPQGLFGDKIIERV
jgi:branched-chain amino acid transport system permease protein